MVFTDRFARTVYMKMLKLAEADTKNCKPVFEKKAKGFRKALSSEFEGIDFEKQGLNEEEVEVLIETFYAEMPQELFNIYEKITLRSITSLRKKFDQATLMLIEAGKAPYHETIRRAIKYAQKHGTAALTNEALNQIKSEVPFEEYKEYLEVASEGVKSLMKNNLEKGLKDLKKDIEAQLPDIGAEVFGAVNKAIDIYIDDVTSGLREFTLEKIYGKSKAE